MLLLWQKMSLLLLWQKMSLLFFCVTRMTAGTLLLTHQNEFSLFVNLSMDISLCFVLYKNAAMYCCIINLSMIRSLFQCTYVYNCFNQKFLKQI